VSLGASIADAIAALRSDAEKETLVIAGGGKLLDGLLAAAAGASAGEEREAAERALLNLLATRARGRFRASFHVFRFDSVLASGLGFYSPAGSVEQALHYLLAICAHKNACRFPQLEGFPTAAMPTGPAQWVRRPRTLGAALASSSAAHLHW